MNYAKEDIIRFLEQHFESHGWPIGLTQKKLNDRSQIANDEHFPSQPIVEIERHRPILGDTYTKGLPMNNYEIYYMRYAVDFHKSNVQCLPERVAEDIYVDVAGFAASQLRFECFNLTIELIDSGVYQLTEQVSNDKLMVSTFEEAKAFVLGLADSVNDSFSVSLDREDRLTSVDRQNYMRQFEREIESRLSDKVEQIWKERDL